MASDPTSMNNRKPGGSRDSERQQTMTPRLIDRGALPARQTPQRNAAPQRVSGPVLSGTALFGPDPDSENAPS